MVSVLQKSLIALLCVIMVGCGLKESAETCTPIGILYIKKSTTQREPIFEIYEISDSIFALINGVSYHENSPVGRKELRLLKVTHYDASENIKTGEIICNRQIADDLIDVFKGLYESKYPIERIELIDRYDGDDKKSMMANNTSCYNCRQITAGGKLSRHAYGMAIDINPLYNPYVKTSGGKVIRIEPEGAEAYADASARQGKYVITKGDVCYRLMRAHGFKWGGDWTRTVRDYQHFER